MHELAIADSVLKAVEAEAARRPGTRIVKIGLRVGELAGVDPDALSFSFEVLVRGTKLEPLLLEIERCPQRHRCRLCGCTFLVADFEVACPECGAAQTHCIAGDELELAYLEVEEP